MILEYLEHLRTLPLAVRRMRAVFIAGMITACIALVWLSVLYFGKSSYLNSGQFTEAPAPATRDSMPDFSASATEYLERYQAGGTRGGDTIPTDTPANYQPAAAFVPESTSTPVDIPEEQTVSGATTTRVESDDTGFVEDILREVEP